MQNPMEPIDLLRLRLLQGKTWRYLRYLHFREYLRRVADNIESVCICGAGHGLAETALAIEFPHITFTLTDIIVDKKYPNYHQAMQFCWQHKIDNLRFSIWNVLTPAERKFDMVSSTEMLEHIKDARTAAANMVAASSRYLYCLVPYADDDTNADHIKRKGAWERHEHYVCGYDEKDLRMLFPTPTAISGAYWRDGGALLRRKLEELNTEQISQAYQTLIADAQIDIVDRLPTTGQCLGIKILSIV